jgi:predicted NBD/HSP70 family sugar kinase
MAERESSEIQLIRAVHRHGVRNAAGWRDTAFAGLSQTQLAGEVGLSRPTVSGLVDRGRSILAVSSAGVNLDPAKTGVALGIDFGQNHHRIALADIHGQILPQSERETATPVGPDNLATAALSIDWAIDQVTGVLTDAGLTIADVCAVGVSLPGPVDGETKKLYHSPDPDRMDRSWEIVDVRERLQARLEVPLPTVDSDYNASALAEHLWGATRDSTDALYVKISQRCAVSLLINHRIYRGADGFAGRLGKTRLVNADLSEHWVLVEDVFSLPALRKVCDAPLSADQIVQLARSDELVDAALRSGARALGVALAPIIDAFNPGSLVIGGALGVSSLAWVASDLLEGIVALGDSPARANISGRIQAGAFARASAVRGVIAGALLESAPSYLASRFLAARPNNGAGRGRHSVAQV